MTTITIPTKVKAKRIARVSIKPKKCPNPLFVKWIKEWIEEAVTKDTKVRFGYRKALVSLKNYPLVLKSGKECAILQDFGPKLCARLDRRLSDHNGINGPPKKPEAKQRTAKNTSKKTFPPPEKNSAVVDNNVATSSTACNVALPVAPVFATNKRNAAAALAPMSPVKKGKKDNNFKPTEDLILQPGSFQIILIVDNAEVFGNTKAGESATRQELTNLNVNHHVRSLKVGDYCWVAQDVSSGSELVLPYIVERKRIDDLAGSIKDGRYREQKFRMKQCGIQNLIYLIESTGKGDLHVGLPLKTLQQASVNTQIHSKFSVKHTSSHKASMEYIASMTKIITRIFKDKILLQCRKDSLENSNINDEIVSLMHFEEFNKGASKIKKWRVKDMFIKHLLQLRGVSVEKAVAIAEKYPSPQALLTAYYEDDRPAMLLASIPCGQSRTVGPTISVAVHKLYTSKSLA